MIRSGDHDRIHLFVFEQTTKILVASHLTFKALAHFGAPIAGYSPEDFKREGFWFQLGVPPVRIDILLSIPRVV